MKAVFYGGQQALRLSQSYLRQAANDENASWMPDHLPIMDNGVEFLRGVDKIVCIEGGGPALDAEALELTAEIVRLPELQLDFLWPFSGQPHIANDHDENYPDGPFPAELGDAWLNRALEGPLRFETIEETYLALDVARVVDLGRLRDLSLARQANRDALYGVDFAARIAAGFRSPSLFLSARTLGPQMFAAQAEVVFARLGRTYSAAAEPPPDVRELPIHPRVAEYFGLDGPHRRACLGTWSTPVDFPEYVRRYLAYAEGPELERGLSLLGSPRPQEAAAQLETAAARPMGRRCSSARLGLFLASALALEDLEKAAEIQAFTGADTNDPDILTALTAFAQRRLSLAESRILAYLARAPNHAEAFAMLAAIREARGDAEGAFAALELAAGLRPDDIRLSSRLTKALTARGDTVGAVRSAEAEAALDPLNPHRQASLAQVLIDAGWRRQAQETLDQALALVGDAPDHVDLRATLTERRAALAG